MPNPVVHFEINTANPEKVQRFYAKVFNWAITKVPNFPTGYWLVSTVAGGRGIDGGIGTAQGGNAVTFYIEVADPDAYLRKVQQAGGKVVVPTTVVPDMVTFAQFADPDGNVTGLLKSDPQAQPLGAGQG